MIERRLALRRALFPLAAGIALWLVPVVVHVDRPSPAVRVVLVAVLVSSLALQLLGVVRVLLFLVRR